MNNKFLFNFKNASLRTLISNFLKINQSNTINSYQDILKFSKGFTKGLFSINDYPDINLKTNQRNLIKILQKKDNTYFPISIENKNLKLHGKGRLKGDREIHKVALKNSSFRINLKKEFKIFGLEEFSIQKPVIRGYTWEFLIHEIFKNEGLLNLKLIPINFKLNGDRNGLYTIEEIPSKLTIERNKRKNGPIFYFSSSASSTDNGYGLNSSILKVYEEKKWRNNSIYQYSKNKLLQEIDSINKNEIFKENLFDIDEWSKFFALIDVFNVFHGSLIKSVKFYFNPTVGKFQPLLSDAHFGALSFPNNIHLDFILNFEKYKNINAIEKNIRFYNAFFKNKNFLNNYLKYLEIYSSEKFIKKIENIYEKKFKSLDEELYSRFSKADNIESYSMLPYLFKLNQITEKRNFIIRNKVLYFEQNKKFIEYRNNIKNNENLNHSINDIIFSNQKIEVINLKDFKLIGETIEFKKPTMLILQGSTILKSFSKNEYLNINGPIIIVQEGVDIKIENVNINSIFDSKILNRNLSGTVNFLNSDVIINKLSIDNSRMEDSINIVNSKFKIDKIKIQNSNSDALDIDFSDGTIEELYCNNIFNDCLDTSESKTKTSYIFVNKVGDKAISAGENSHLEIGLLDGKDVEIGVSSKDGSLLYIDLYNLTKVKLDGAVFIKKNNYNSPELVIKKVSNEAQDKKYKILKSKSSKINVPQNFIIEEKKSIEIFNILYGNEYGKETLKQ